MKIVWTHWRRPKEIAAMKAAGTLPTEEFEVVDHIASYLASTKYGGRQIVEFIVQSARDKNEDAFRDGGKIVILEPEAFADAYEISVSWKPTFFIMPSSALRP